MTCTDLNTLTTCDRCGGAGRISAYAHIAGGECFECNGSGYSEARTVRAGQMGTTHPHGTTNAPKPTAVKHVTIPGLGEGTMTTFDGVRFGFESHELDYQPSVFFMLRGRRVSDVSLANGFIVAGYTEQKVRRLLQAALKR
jgi:hypothetical protein